MNDSFHHVVPKQIHEHFPDDLCGLVDSVQVKVDRDTHDLIEAMNKPLIYLLENGYPKSKAEFDVFMSHVAVAIAPYTHYDTTRYRVIDYPCPKCGYKTPINPRSHKTKYCRNCGGPIYNIRESNDKMEEETK